MPDAARFIPRAGQYLMVVMDELRQTPVFDGLNAGRERGLARIATLALPELNLYAMAVSGSNSERPEIVVDIPHGDALAT